VGVIRPVQPTERNDVTQSSSRLPIVLAGLVAALGLGAGAGIATYAALDEPSTVVREVTVSGFERTTTADGEGLSAATIYERVHRGVVEISTTSFAGGGAAQGSGFVYDADGHIVTNQHVVEGGDEVNVRFPGGAIYPAELMGTDGSTDLAVVKVDAPASVLEPLRLGDSNAVEVGHPVVALGSPFGLEGTITSGIVSALHRPMEAPNGFTINDSIQTDAAINHGNSGGPLLDSSGRVIGVNAQIESNSGGNDGVGFAIPSNTVRSIVSQLIETGDVEHAYLGVGLTAVEEGVAITKVQPDTPAAKAELRPATGTETVAGQQLPRGGDVIVEIDGIEVSTEAEVQGLINAKKPGDTIELTVLRGGDRERIEVTLGTQPPQAPS
jgi:S1-C subfamily serine protease